MYGIPVTFYGEDYLKYNEAVDLIQMGTAISVSNSKELIDTFKAFLNDNYAANEVKQKLNTFFEKNANVSSKVLATLHL